MGKTSARGIRLRTLGQSYKKTLIAPNEFCFLVKKYEKLPPPIKHFKEIFIIFATQKIMTIIQDFLLLDCFNTTQLHR